ncbi:hypothetical protein [Nocardioides sp. NPDC006273]|uniref:hypothetical protein n=1 Tax=Nocardioides sp. NPDC006273 TaxID=3155598 RepID=UPI0033BF3830
MRRLAYRQVRLNGVPSTPVTLPEVTPFRGREKWGEVVGNSILAALGAVLTWVAFTQVPARVVPVRVAAWFTAFAVGITLVLIVALVLTKHLPTIRERNVDGVRRLEVHAWSGDRWHAIALDTALACGGLIVAVFGLQTGSDWALASLGIGLGGIWFLGRVLLAAFGRRRNERIVLLDEYIVHSSALGRSRSLRSAVQDVRARGNAVFVTLRSPAAVYECPGLWRGSRQIPTDIIVIKCSMMGHTANGLAQWLRSELELTSQS